MNISNVLITDKQWNIVSMGNDFIEFIKGNIPEPFAYAAGFLEKEDIIILIADCSCDYFCDLAEVKEYIKNKNHMDMNKIVCISSFENNFIDPIVCSLSDSIKNSSLIDTVYLGSRLNVTIISSDNAKISINNQTVSIDILNRDCMLIADNRGIKFNSQLLIDNKREIENVIKTRKFVAAIENNVFEKRKYKIKDIFVENVYASLEELYKSAIKEQISNWDGKKIIVNKHDLSRELLCFRIFTKENIVASAKTESSKYWKILNLEDKDCILGPFSAFRLWGTDGKVMKLQKLLQKASKTNVTMLITGESGTGKTYLARKIYQNSSRKEETFVHVNCAAIPYNLIESELFGYEEGAFTGANKGGKIGYFEAANNGTLFLDEITEIPLELQGKLLEVLQSKTFYRVGGTKKIKLDVRLIAATNRNLHKMVNNGRFREDLFYRINVFPIELPPLRERKESFESIAMHVLPKICIKLGIEPVTLSISALEKMKKYSWPGNIRELENILEKACILCEHNIIGKEDIIFSERVLLNKEDRIGETLKEFREHYEKIAIMKALDQCNGEKKAAAKLLNIGKTSLFEKLRRYNIQEGKNDECK